MWWGFSGPIIDRYNGLKSVASVANLSSKVLTENKPRKTRSRIPSKVKKPKRSQKLPTRCRSPLSLRSPRKVRTS